MLKTPGLSRRETLGALLRTGGAALFVPAWNETIEAASTITCTPATPTVTEGPYWVDEMLFRSDVRTDPSTGTARAGIPLSLSINVQNLVTSGCSALTGAYVDIWHCDAKGIYSDESTYNPGGGTGNVNTTGQKFLRGYQITDANGTVNFTTIYPGWYSGRTIHIHVRVRTYSGTTVLSNFVTQIFFDDAMSDVILATPAYSRTTARYAQFERHGLQRREREPHVGDAHRRQHLRLHREHHHGAVFQTPAAATPAITTGGVGNALSGSAGIASGAWISIFGSNLSSITRPLNSTDLVNRAIPTSLEGVRATTNNRAAYVQYVSPTQINVLAPQDASVGSVAVTVTNAAGTSNSVTANLQAALPGLAVLSSYVRAVRYPDSAIINGTGNAESGYTTAAAIGPGDVLSLFGTGFGPTTPAASVGTVFSGAYPATNKVTVTIGGVSATVSWAGIVAAGLYQINVVVPATLADGTYPVIATVTGVNSQTGAMLKVAASAKFAAGRGGSRLGNPQPPMVVRRTIEELAHLAVLTGPMTPARHEGSLVQMRNA